MQKTDIRKFLKDPSLFKEEAFINGEWFKSDSGKTFAVHNPATGELIADVVILSQTMLSKQLKPQNRPFRIGRVKPEKSALM